LKQKFILSKLGIHARKEAKEAVLNCINFFLEGNFYIKKLIIFKIQKTGINTG